MRLFWLRVLVVVTVVAAMCLGQQPKTASKTETSATGVFLGRSGKPMANARLFLGKVQADEEDLQAKVVLKDLPFTQADAQGRFKLSGFVPDRYTIVYYAAGGHSIAPAEISIKALSAVTRSILPAMRNVEIGKDQPMAERRWGPSLALLKGHTFWGQGPNMKVWNATLRRGPTGPYLEVRKGYIWDADFKDKAEIKIDAWSF